MLLTLEVLPAAEGDCLLLHWGDPESPRLAVIDGGPGPVFENALRPRLDEIADKRGGKRLRLDLVIVSHVDNDHIIGIKKLVRGIRKEVEAKVPPQEQAFQMRRLWHNAFNDILGDATDEYYKTFTASYQASLDGKPSETLGQDLEKAFRDRTGATQEASAALATDLALLLAGHEEGRGLRVDHRFLFDANETSALNTPLKDAHGQPTLIMRAGGSSQPLAIDGLTVTIVGPSKDEIHALQVDFDKYIKKNGLAAKAVLAAYADESITNLSSIVCVAEFQGKRILLTGDARGDSILQGLEATGLCPGGAQISVDVLKVPHHGSDRNLTPDFFERIRADTYVFSGDGKHGNPERDTLSWLVTSRPKSDKYEILLTYDVQHIDENREKDLAIQNKRRKPESQIAWDAATMGLKAFFEDRAKNGYAFTLRAGAPRRIDLMGPLP
jgi:beta-lactamase superfamily II metal-dependent hydrolase